jgi:hypothetical protein
MRRALTAVAAAGVLVGLAAPSASADPQCPPVFRAYVSLDNGPGGESPGTFGRRQADLAKGGGRMYGEQVSNNEARKRPPCP